MIALPALVLRPGLGLVARLAARRPVFARLFRAGRLGTRRRPWLFHAGLHPRFITPVFGPRLFDAGLFPARLRALLGSTPLVSRLFGPGLLDASILRAPLAPRVAARVIGTILPLFFTLPLEFPSLAVTVFAHAFGDGPRIRHR